MNYYIQKKDSKEKFIVLHKISDSEGNAYFIITNLMTKQILRISEKQLLEEYLFNGVIG